MMDCQVRSLPRTVNSKVTQRDHAHLIKMRIRRTKKFTRNFCGGVWAQRLREMLIFGEGNCFRKAVNRRARREDKSLNPGYAGGIEQMQGAGDIRVVIKLRVLN